METVAHGTIEKGSADIIKRLIQLKRFHLIDYNFESQDIDGVLYITSFRLICMFYRRLYIRILRDI
jgi:hypothetical protein